MSEGASVATTLFVLLSLEFKVDMRVLSLVVFVLLLGACSKPAPRPEGALDPKGVVVPAGFLSDYSRLRPSDRSDTAYVYLDPTANLSLYKLVILEPVEVKLHPAAKAEGVSKQELQRLAGEFEGEVRKAMGYSYPLVDQAGYGVLRMRFALTDVIPNKPLINIIPGSSFFADGIGGATIEGEFIDSQNGEVLASFIDHKSGGLGKQQKKFTRYGNTVDRFTYWAQLIRDRLDEARGLHVSGRFPKTGRPGSVW